DKRVPWTASRITGSPDPPHPYRIERVFPKLRFLNPLLLARAPGLDRFFVGEQAGKIYSFPLDPKADYKELFFVLTPVLRSWAKNKVRGIEALYGLVFHPQFAKNRYCYICYVLGGKNPSEQLPEGSRVSRFRVSDTDPPRVDPKSEKILITFLGGGHNGGDLHFGNDGMVYISTGDGTSPTLPDALDTGQDISDLLSSILRIDVDHEDKDKPYTVPPDNPFLKTPKARPEIWAYGFRNPWRMSFDRATGDLWVGDVGWQLWEMIYRVEKGGNYGWAITEGQQQPVLPEVTPGPTPILSPVVAHPHSEAASMTGGYVYHGRRFPELQGAYIYGDYQTGRVWGLRYDGKSVTWHQELAQTPLALVSFGEGLDGELYLVDYERSKTIYRLAPNPRAGQKSTFPRKLSETGLFTDAARQPPAVGVLPYEINAHHWADFTTSERWMAAPGSEPVQIDEKGVWRFPDGAVLAKTVSI